MNAGFRWCPHCKGPHNLRDVVCTLTGNALTPAFPMKGNVETFLNGTVLDGKYRLRRRIGKGGMGEVFEAENIVLKRLVAIKVVRRSARPEALVRLEREAQIVASIHHPNICDVHDVGRMPNGSPYVVFERLFGATLAAHARGRQLPTAAAIGIFSQMLSGLQAAHEARIVHRDIKPENVFLVERAGCEPLVKLLDFGFARDLAMEPSRRITRPGRACGTIEYMSPEQLRLEQVDHRSDLFGVGIMLYQALAGRHPFQASSSLELQINILRAAPLPLRVRRPDLPPELEEIIMWALARSPAERPASALELQRALLSIPDLELPSLDKDDAVSVTEPVWVPRASSPSA